MATTTTSASHQVTPTIGEILGDIDKVKSRQGKKDILTKYKDVEALRWFLRGTFDPRVEWLINEEPDFKKEDITPEGEQPNSLYMEIPNCSLFVKGHPSSAKVQVKRLKEILIQILESLPVIEAELYMQMLKKKSKVKGLTSKLVLEVFPNMYKEGG